MTTENQTPLRVGIVGCGYQGGIMAQSVGAGELFRISACADPVLVAAGRVAALAGGAATFTSVDEMLATGAVDVVFVATPHHVLYESALAAIQAGKHVLAEKPIGMDEKEAANWRRR